MTKFLLLPAMLVFFCLQVFADKGDHSKNQQEKLSPEEQELNRYLFLRDSVNKVLRYKTGSIVLSNSNAKLNIPAGFKFINAEQSNFIITEVWGNPKRDNILGIILPEETTPFSDKSYAFVVSYEPMGYVKDDDAKDINYDEMMAEMQKSEVEENKSRVAEGYEPIHLAGWAQKPFYDENKKVLHWAKNIKFGEAENNTLNYDVRVLGRKGILSLNAVAGMSELELVKKDIDKVLDMAAFDKGNTYADFSSGTDHVAAYTVGGLVAGKVLAKVGFFALLAKFGKVIIAAIIGAFYFIRKKLTGRGKISKAEGTEALVTQPETIA